MENNISKLEEFVAKTNESPLISEDSLLLEQELKNIDGHSIDDKFLPLVNDGIAFIFRHKTNKYIVLKTARMHSFSMRIPQIKEEEIEADKAKLAVFLQYKNIIANWFLFANSGEEANFSLNQWMLVYTRFTSEYHFLSIPDFLIENFKKDFEIIGENKDLTDITVETIDVQCPDCDNVFTVISNEKMHYCPCCGNSFSQ